MTTNPFELPDGSSLLENDSTCGDEVREIKGAEFC